MSIFITFEGGEGSGKSTQAQALAQRLKSMGIPVVLTHEPGGTPMGEQIKEWLKDREGRGEVDLDPQTELLLFNAARAQLVSKVIKPALEHDTVVICDRFYHSTIAYQGHGRGLDLELVKSVIELATGGLKPNLIILMDIDVQKGLARKQLLDRFERENIDFHQRVRQSYLGMAHKDPQRWLVVNAALEQKEVEQLIWDWVGQLLPAMRRLGKTEAGVDKGPAVPAVGAQAEIPAPQVREAAEEAPAAAMESVKDEAESPPVEVAAPQEKAEGKVDAKPRKGAAQPGRARATQVVKIEALSPPVEVLAITAPPAEGDRAETETPAAEEGKDKKKGKPSKRKAAAKPKKDTKKVAKKKEK